MGRFKVQVGEEFEVETVKVEVKDTTPKVDPKVIEEEHRKRLSTWVLGFVGLFMVGAALLGLYEGHFGKFQSFYNAAAIPVGVILSFYFKDKSLR
jgi:hypothetical protein